MTELRVGALVAFPPGSPMYEEGYRRGVVVAFETLGAHVQRMHAVFARLDSGTEEDRRRRERISDGAEDLVLPIIRTEPCKAAPAGFEFPIHPNLFVVVGPDASAN